MVKSHHGGSPLRSKSDSWIDLALLGRSKWTIDEPVYQVVVDGALPTRKPLEFGAAEAQNWLGSLILAVAASQATSSLNLPSPHFSLFSSLTLRIPLLW